MNQRRCRQFLTTIAAVSGDASTKVFSAERTQLSSALFHEVARDVPLNTGADVIVYGNGPARVTAAINVERAGAKVRLFELHGSLGGVWTSSLLSYVLEFDKPGFNVEPAHRLSKCDAIMAAA